LIISTRTNPKFPELFLSDGTEPESTVPRPELDTVYGSTPPRNEDEGVARGAQGFIGAEEGEGIGDGEGQGNDVIGFEGNDRANVGLGDGRNGGSSE
jgi:hypothetical protein